MLTKLHQRQAKMEESMTGLSQIVKERAKAKAPDLPIDLIQRSVKTEVPEKQELQRLKEAQCTKAMTKQDEIPRTERPGTCHRYYLFMEDDSSCLIEQRDKEGNVQFVKDTDTNQVLPMDHITEAGAEMYQIPEKDQKLVGDDAETISSTSTADYDREEVETSLTTIADAFHTIGQEYEKLVGVVPHMSKIQTANVVAQMPILSFVKQETKMENKPYPAVNKATEPEPSTSHKQPIIPEGAGTVPIPSEVIEETAKKEDDEPETEVTDETQKRK